jgi:hypothetical protein
MKKALVHSSIAAAFGLMSAAMIPAATAQQQTPPKAEEEVAYTPPLRGAPQRRIGGSSRGTDTALPSVFVLAPDHVGLTTSEQPSLYWYLTGPTRVRVEVTLVDEKQVTPVVEMPVAQPTSEGMQRLRLSDLRLALKPGVEYQWTVSLVPDSKERSNDVISGGVIKRVAPPAGLNEKLAAAPREARPRLLAAAGLWYDAIAELSEQIEASPGNRTLREQRAKLLEQIGLADAAAYDRKMK